MSSRSTPSVGPVAAGLVHPAADGTGSAEPLPEKRVEAIVRRSSRSQRRYRRGVRVRTLKILLGLLVFLVLLGVLAAWVYVGALEAQNSDLQAQLDKEHRALTGLKTQVTQLASERAKLVQGRIPGLRPIAYDRAIAISRKYVRNIIFTLTGEERHPAYEYRLVLSNDSLSVVRPQVTILLFDARGIQIGVTNVTVADATARTDKISLDPGETRSYSADITVSSNTKPKYFLLHIQ